ncbi:female-specific protein transformer isoform X2 [Condylostylus longicornis]|uniref:female-specific protein transformer isoform X2 n=1 Tax=Condylostylus longicornis TaxID=2530218 RepID=UPI00244DA714|nr:female-specific protein transformer isoform X2 [Condylostylus longicornis]
MNKQKNRATENEVFSTSTLDKHSTSTGKHTINKTASSTRQPTKCAKHSIDSDEIVISRRYDEGNKPPCVQQVLNTSDYKSTQKSCFRKGFSSSSSSSPERYRDTEKNINNQKRERNFKSSSPEKRRSTKKEKIPYFADEKREEERLERKWKLSAKKIKKEKHNRESKDKISDRKSPRSYRRSRSNSRQRSHHRKRRRSSDRHRRSRSISYRRTRSRTRSRSRSRDKYRMRNASVMPSMFPVMIATPSSSDYFYGTPNWMPPIVPIAPQRFPGFIPRFPGSIMTPFAPMAVVPRYPLPVHNSRYHPHTIRQPRSQRFKAPNRGFHRPRCP